MGVASVGQLSKTAAQIARLAGRCELHRELSDCPGDAALTARPSRLAATGALSPLPSLPLMVSARR